MTLFLVEKPKEKFCIFNNKAQYLDPLKLFEGFSGISGVTFSAGLKILYQFFHNFQNIEIIIGLAEDFLQANEYFFNQIEVEKEELIKRLLSTPKNLTLYFADRVHSKFYLLYDDERVLRRAIVTSANLSESALKGTQDEIFVVFEEETILKALEEHYLSIKAKAKTILESAKIYKETLEKRDLFSSVEANLSHVSQEKGQIEVTQLQTLLRDEKVKKEVSEKMLRDLTVKSIQFIQERADRYSLRLEKETEILKEFKEKFKEIKEIPKHWFETEKGLEKLLDQLKSKRSVEESKIIIKYSSEKATFLHLEEDLDPVRVKRDVEILNRLIWAYGKQGLDNKEIFTTVLLFAFSSIYGWLWRYKNYREGRTTFQGAPVFCFLAGTAKTGKTFLLSVLSRLFKVKKYEYGKIEKRNNTRSWIIESYLLGGTERELAPLLLDEVKTSEFRDGMAFAEKIKTLSNEPFLGDNPSHGHIFIASNLEQFETGEQILRRGIFLGFTKPIEEKEFLIDIKGVRFNELSGELSKAFVFWLRENLERLERELKTFDEERLSSFDHLFKLSAEFLRKEGVQIVDLPQGFGTYDFFVQRSWKRIYEIHGRELFIDKGKIFLIKKEVLPRYLRPLAFFTEQDACTQEYYALKKEEFLTFVGDKTILKGMWEGLKKFLLK